MGNLPIRYCSSVWKKASQRCTVTTEHAYLLLRWEKRHTRRHPSHSSSWAQPVPMQGLDCPAFHSDSTWETRFALQMLANCNGCSKERDNWSNLFCLQLPTRKRTLFRQSIIHFKTFNFSDDISLLLFLSCLFASLGSKPDSRLLKNPLVYLQFPGEQASRPKHKNFTEAVWSFLIYEICPQCSAFLNVVFLSPQLFTLKWLILVNNATCLLADWC